MTSTQALADASAQPELLTEKHDKHWVLTLNRPHKMNALSASLVEHLLTEINAAEAENVPLLVLRGAGKNFSAGFDFSDLATESEGDLLLRFVRIETLLQRLAYSTCSTLALVHGANFGAGVDLIATCKHRLAAAGSRFRMPGLKFGLALGTGRLAELLGTETARDLLETTRLFTVDEAEKLRFIHRQSDPQEWDVEIEAALQAALSLSTSSRKALYQLSVKSDPNRDMAALASSASEPGLKERILSFRAGT